MGREEIFDTQVQGFGVRIGQRHRAFFFIRRVNGEKMRFSLGQHPAVTLSKARAGALDILHRIENGEDPRDQARLRKQLDEEEAENTFARIGARFIVEYCEGKKKPLRARTIQGYRWALLGEPSAAWSSRPLTSITDRDVVKVIDKYEKQGKFGAARLFHTYLRKFFNWSAGKRLVDENPVKGVALASDAADFRRNQSVVSYGASQSGGFSQEARQSRARLSDDPYIVRSTTQRNKSREMESSATKWRFAGLGYSAGKLEK